MGYRSDVTIICRPKAYEMFKEAWEPVDFKPRVLVTDDNDHILKWYDVKWYSDYKQVKAIEGVMRKIRNEYDTDEEYAFKKIEIGEDNDTIEECSEAAWNVYEDVYVMVEVNLPDAKEIKQFVTLEDCQNCARFYECDNMGFFEECQEKAFKYFEKRD